MATKKGGRREGAGRKKGVPNKRTQEVAAKIAELGCDPIEGMVRVAEMAEKELLKLDRFQDRKDALTLAGNMYKELGQYWAAKRRAIEVSDSDGGALQVVISGKDARI